MTEEQAGGPSRERKSALPRLLLLGVVMLVIAVLVNLKSIVAIASGKKTVKSVLHGKRYIPIRQTFRFPAPMGPEDAKVKAQVIAQEGNSCHEPLIALWMGIADLEPQRLRVGFGRGLVQEKPGEGSEVPDIGCESGVILNGENKFVSGSGEQERTIYLTGPPFNPIAEPAGADDPATPADGHGWTLTDIAEIVNQVIEDEYGEKGNLTGAAIEEAWQAAGQRVPRPESGDALGGPAQSGG